MNVEAVRTPLTTEGHVEKGTLRKFEHHQGFHVVGESERVISKLKGERVIHRVLEGILYRFKNGN